MRDAAESSLAGHRFSTAALRRRAAAAVGLLLGALALSAHPALASVGYAPDPSTPTINLQGDQPGGVAIDQSSQRIYVAMLSANLGAQQTGQVEQLESSGAAAAASPFKAGGGQPFFSGVAVNPVTQGLYASEFIVSTPLGAAGASQIDQFSSSGTLGTQFSTSGTAGIPTRIAADSSGNVFFPNTVAHTVQVFNAAGTLQKTISCSGCPGGGFVTPNGVAIDSADNLYVVDIGGDRVIKLTPSGGQYVFASAFQSGRGAVAVGVDPSDNSVFVGDYVEGGSYHIVAYSSSGTQTDDFGAGLFTAPQFGARFAGQIAANATTHRLYVSDPDASALRVFARATIPAPTATASAASSVGQIEAKLNAVVNAKSHATIDCHFEYVDDTDFLANEYADASDVPCNVLPDGSENTSVSATLSDLSPSTTYHFRVHAANNGGEVTAGSQTFSTLAVAPATVTAVAPSAVTQTTAILAAKVNPHGGTVSDCQFEYGEGLSYATSRPCPTTIGPVTTDVTESLKATGLSPKTNYHYRLSVTTNASTVVGDPEEFTTLPPPPTVTTGVASGITQTGATIAGAINPNGATASCHFVYGPTTSYGSSVACPSDPGAGESAVGEQVELSGLAPHTTYHYRLVGENGGGTTNGLDASFSTPQYPPIEPQPLPPPTGPVVVAPKKPLKCKKGFQKKKVRGKLRCVKRKKHRRR
jgi:hypothetical protein